MAEAADYSTDSIKQDMKYRCSYCGLILEEMEDPIRLPCGDVFCYQCLDNDYDYRGFILCPCCRKKYDNITMKDIGKYRYNDWKEPKDGIPELICDNCDQPAEVFCTKLECERPFCTRHLKSHNENFANGAHESGLIAIQDYAKAPKAYAPLECSEHSKKRVRHACSECFQTFCIQCKTNTPCSPQGRTRWDWHMYQNLKDILSKTKSSIRITLGLTDSMTYHNVKDINELASEIKSCYKTKILKDIVEKIRDIHDVDKELGREVDADEYHQKDLMRRVDDIAESQIASIRRQARVVKNEIEQHGKRRADKSASHGEDMIARKDKLHELWQHTNKFLNTENNLTIIKDHCSRASLIDGELNVSLKEENKLPRPQIKSDANTDTKLALELIIHKDHLKYRRSWDMPCEVRSIANDAQAEVLLWTAQSDKSDESDENLFGGSYRNIASQTKRKIDLKLCSVKHAYLHTFILLGLDISGTAYIKTFSSQFKESPGKGHEIVISKPENFSSFKIEHQQSLMSLRVEQSTITEVLVLHRKKENHILSQFSSNGTPFPEIIIPSDELEIPGGFQAIDKDCVLVTDCLAAGSLHKYQVVSKTSLRRVWTCPNLNLPGPICVEEKGKILVASCSQPGKIYLFTPEGSLITELTSDTLERPVHSMITYICLHGKDLTVAVSGKQLSRFELVTI